MRHACKVGRRKSKAKVRKGEISIEMNIACEYGLEVSDSGYRKLASFYVQVDFFF